MSHRGLAAPPRGGAPRPYADPYVAGVGLGLVLTAAFALAGRGLGASGAFAAGATALVHAVSPDQAAASPYLSRYLDAAVAPWRDWLVVEIAGAIAGGWLSARLAGRLALVVERGPRLAPGPRLAFAGLGGAAMGVGAVLARGCTSGQALTGGALLSVGSWLFITGAFASAYLVAPLARRLWR
ncbi:MAG: YeeE/YedE thiosulfate transporter family protein [Vicinamibacterales bacterium]